MSYEFWAIIGVGAAIVCAIIVAASENEKRLDHIAALLARANEMKHEDRTGEWRDSYR